MKTQRRIAGLIFVVLLGLSLVDSVARAATADDGWRLSVPLYISAGAYYLSGPGHSDAFSSANASGELVVSSPTSPYSAALFVDYHFSPDKRYNGAFSVGGYAQFQGSRWDTTAALFNHDAPDSADVWAYAGRIRYRFARRHKVGFEFLGALRDASSPGLGIGYYGDISDTLSIKIVAGPNLKSGSKRAARTELVWQFN